MLSLSQFMDRVAFLGGCKLTKYDPATGIATLESLIWKRPVDMRVEINHLGGKLVWEFPYHNHLITYLPTQRKVVRAFSNESLPIEDEDDKALLRKQLIADGVPEKKIPDDFTFGHLKEHIVIRRQFYRTYTENIVAID